MPSPFPGMNPYLEQEDVWEDFHASLILVLRELLERSVGNEQAARMHRQAMRPTGFLKK